MKFDIIIHIILLTTCIHIDIFERFKIILNYL